MKTLTSGIILSVLVSLFACGGEDSLVGEPIPNSPPDTEITSTPPNLDRATFSISFYWKGFDPDGDVVGFEWRISNNGRDGTVDVGDTLQALLPWRFTSVTDSTFVVSARFDSLDADVRDPDLEPGEYRFWETHTFFIRAVDDKGARDPSPANVSFTATTLAPSAIIDVPKIKPGITCTSAARVLTFGWRGRDPDAVSRVPEAVRWILLPFDVGEGRCANQSEYETIQPIRADDRLWSPWIAYDAPEGRGRTVTLPRQDAGRIFLFAVQVRDTAGAISPLFEWNRNVRYVSTSDGKLPVLRVDSNVSGQQVFVGTRGLATIEILEGQSLEFRWIGDASDYAGVIDAYQYGWNVSDPEDPNDPGWAVGWGNSPEWRRAGPFTFTHGSPNLVIQCRDNSGSISRALFQFQVIPFIQRSSQRNLLVVDDFPNGDTATQMALERIWDKAWEDMFEGEVLGFSRVDMIDAQTDRGRINFSTINGYKSVIWFTSPSIGTYFHNNLAPSSTGEFRLNWLEVYQANVGNLLVCGPGSMLNSVERAGTWGGKDWMFPIVFNVSAGGNLGFGTATTPDGRTYNVGTLRWPYTGWCLEAIDHVRPSLNRIHGETPSNLLRSWQCDSIIRADVDETFFETYPDAMGRVGTLLPTTPREIPDREYLPEWEEFFNRNVTNRRVSLYLRDCQVSMYRLRARRDEGWVEDPLLGCYPGNREVSTLDGVPIAVASTAHSETKALVGSEDFLWGFHPLSFEFQGVQDALLWIAETRWQLSMRR